MPDKRFLPITAKYDGKCKECSEGISEGDRVVFDTEERKVYCKACGDDLTEPEKESKPSPVKAASVVPSSNRASDKQVSAIKNMLRRLERVSQFDSRPGSGDKLASEIETEIDGLGGFDKLSKRQASNYFERIGSLLDDEM